MQIIEGQLVATNQKMAFVVSRFNELVTERLLEGALDCFKRHGGQEQHITVVKVPGAFELPLIAKKLAKTGKYDGVVCLGAVIQGATAHFDYVCSGSTSGIMNVNLETEVPVAFGVLTTESLEQAMERSGSKAGNKGAEVTLGVIECIDIINKIK